MYMAGHGRDGGGAAGDNQALPSAQPGALRDARRHHAGGGGVDPRFRPRHRRPEAQAETAAGALQAGSGKNVPENIAYAPITLPTVNIDVLVALVTQTGQES
jgi:hypothetical protein